MNRRLFLASLVLVTSLSGCDGPTGPRGSMQLRLQNDAAVALTIRVGSTDFGSIEPGAMSPYREIGEGELPIMVAGVNRGTESWCTGSGCKAFDGTMKWTGYFNETAITGFSYDFE